MASIVVYFINLPSALCCAINVLYVAFWAFVTNCENQELNLINVNHSQDFATAKGTELLVDISTGIFKSGVPMVSRTLGQSQFLHPHPVSSWQHRCEE